MMKAWQPLYITAILLLFFARSAKATDTLIVNINQQQLMQGDSLQMEALLEGNDRAGSQTIQLWIENTETGRQWKYRFPLIDGYVSMSLKIDPSIPNGRYAFNFLLQQDFFNIDGKILNEHYKDKSINYLMVARNKQTVIGDVMVNPGGTFKGRRFLFQDTAFLIFSPIKRNRENDLNISIKTSLDSAFTPAAVATKLIRIGKMDSVQDKILEQQQPYIFKIAKKDFRIMLSEVVVVSKTKKIIEQFENENTSGLFSGSDAIVFDGLSNDDISNSVDIFSFLQSHVGGLQSGVDSETGLPMLEWRKARTDIFINEIRATDFSPSDINPADIAMIKVFRPGTSLTGGSGAGGAIAIYTRKGNYERPGAHKYSFYLRGYNALDAVWK